MQAFVRPSVCQMLLRYLWLRNSLYVVGGACVYMRIRCHIGKGWHKICSNKIESQNELVSQCDQLAESFMGFGTPLLISFRYRTFISPPTLQFMYILRSCLDLRCACSVSLALSFWFSLHHTHKLMHMKPWLAKCYRFFLWLSAGFAAIEIIHSTGDAVVL